MIKYSKYTVAGGVMCLLFSAIGILPVAFAQQSTPTSSQAVSKDVKTSTIQPTEKEITKSLNQITNNGNKTTIVIDQNTGTQKTIARGQAAINQTTSSILETIMGQSAFMTGNEQLQGNSVCWKDYCIAHIAQKVIVSFPHAP
jgi:hypothetical protein